MLAKAAAIGADEIVVDLEDAVAAPMKDEARARVVELLRDRPSWAARTVSVRVNAPRTPWCHRDLVALATAAGVDSVVVPKIEGAGELAFVDRLLDGVEAEAGRAEPLRTQALIETAAGLERADEIAASSERLDALILGYADLAASLGRPAAPDQDPGTWLPAQHALVTAARAHGRQPIDGPHLGVAADERFLAAATRARELGFDGKWAIHPAQVAALNELFSPSDEEVEHAEAVLAALADAEQRGAGAVSVDGAMVDEAMRATALQTLARARGDG
jgi:citrate lyase subunit beta / citryl-CoA lyase